MLFGSPFPSASGRNARNQQLPAGFQEEDQPARRAAMADDKTKSGGQHQASIADDLEAEALHLAEATDLSPNQARELIRRHGGDRKKLMELAKTFKAES
jgi:hypothetical protein